MTYIKDNINVQSRTQGEHYIDVHNFDLEKQQISLELIWIQQAIESRKQVLYMTIENYTSYNVC